MKNKTGATMSEIRIKSEPNVQSSMTQYVNSYFAESKNTVISTVKIAKIVLDVYNKYSNKDIEWTDFNYFCEQVKLNPTSSQFRKYLCIGNKADRIEEYLDDMPSAVSVIYQITTLEADKFEELVEKKAIHPNLTLKELKEVTSQKTSSETQEENEDKTVSNKFEMKLSLDVSKTDGKALMTIRKFLGLIEYNENIEINYPRGHFDSIFNEINKEIDLDY